MAEEKYVGSKKGQTDLNWLLHQVMREREKYFELTCIVTVANSTVFDHVVTASENQLGRNQKKILKCKDLSLKTKMKISHMMVFSVTMYYCERQTRSRQEANKKRINQFKHNGGELYSYHGLPESHISRVLNQIKPELL